MPVAVGHERVREVVYPLLGLNAKNGSFLETVVVAHQILLPIWIFPERI